MRGFYFSEGKAKSQSGFTLIEILVFLGVFFAVSAIVGGVLVSTLRSSQKTKTLDDVRHNGDFALNTMSRMIRNAGSITSCGGTTIAVQSPDGLATTFACSGDTISSNSASLLNQDAVKVVSGTCNFTCQGNLVKIGFSLSQKSTSTFAEIQARVDFQTSVVLRSN